MSASESVEIEDARQAVLETIAATPAVAVELDRALGRVLAEDVVAEQHLPPFDSSAMDGYAVRAADVAAATAERPVVLPIGGESRAGAPAAGPLRAAEACAISTGAQVPAGADTVVRVERTRRTPDGSAVEVLAGADLGAELRRAGEDVRAGQRVLGAGSLLEPAALGVLASLARTTVLCAERPRVAVLVTGDELLEPGQQPAPGTIRDSNSVALAALARRAGAEVILVARVADDAHATGEMIREAVEASDVTVISGGVSVGAHDHVRPSLERLGARQVFWGLALRPGHPTWFGTLAGKPVFALPGNPVSAMVTFTLLVTPALGAMQGAPARRETLLATLDGGYSKAAGRAHAIRCILTSREDGWHARPTGPQGSHVLTSMLAADALAIVPSAVTSVSAGERVEVLPLRAPMGAGR